MHGTRGYPANTGAYEDAVASRTVWRNHIRCSSSAGFPRPCWPNCVNTPSSDAGRVLREVLAAKERKQPAQHGPHLPPQPRHPLPSPDATPPLPPRHPSLTLHHPPPPTPLPGCSPSGGAPGPGFPRAAGGPKAPVPRAGGFPRGVFLGPPPVATPRPTPPAASAHFKPDKALPSLFVWVSFSVTQGSGVTSPGKDTDGRASAPQRCGRRADSPYPAACPLPASVRALAPGNACLRSV